jgi:hypothetical protein
VPVVDRELPLLTGLERAAEVCRFMTHKLEYALSPLGHLREFIKFNIRLAICIAIPILMVAPLVTVALKQFQLWIDLLAKTTSNLVLFPLSVILVIGLISGLVYIGKSLLIMRLRYSQQRRDPYGY